MSYDIEDSPHAAGPPVTTIKPLDRRDLDSIVTLMEFAALILTSKPGTTFTRDELFREACNIAGPGAEPFAVDFDIVLANSRGILKRLPGGKYRSC